MKKPKPMTVAEAGRRGGQSGGGKAVLQLSPEERTKLMRERALARWKAYRARKALETLSK